MKRLLGWAVLAGVCCAAFACVGSDPDIESKDDAGQGNGDGGPPAENDAGDDATADAGPPPATGTARFVKAIQTPNAMTLAFVTGTAISRSDEVVASGILFTSLANASVDFGDGKTVAITSAMGQVGFVAKYAADGTCQWVTVANGPSAAAEVLPIAVSFTPTGEVVMAAQANSPTVTVGGAVVARSVGMAGRDVCVVKLNADGSRAWHVLYGGPSIDEPDALAVRANGDIAIGGAFTRANGGDVLTFGGTVQLLWPPSLADAAGVVLLDGATGLGKWARAIPPESAPVGTDRSIVRVLAFDSKGDVLAGGDFNRSMQFRDNGQTPINLTATSEDGWLGKINGVDGTVSWAKAFASPGQDRVTGVAVDAQDNVIFSGHYMGAMMLGTAALPANGGADVFLAKLDSGGTVFSFAHGMGATDAQFNSGVALDPWGRIVVVGRQDAAFTWNGKSTTGGGGANDGYVLKTSPDGAIGLWAHGLGSSANDDVFAVSVSPTSGRTAIVGSLGGAATLAGQAVTAPAQGGNFGYVLVLDP